MQSSCHTLLESVWMFSLSLWRQMEQGSCIVFCDSHVSTSSQGSRHQIFMPDQYLYSQKFFYLCYTDKTYSYFYFAVNLMYLGQSLTLVGPSCAWYHILSFFHQQRVCNIIRIARFWNQFCWLDVEVVFAPNAYYHQMMFNPEVFYETSHFFVLTSQYMNLTDSTTYHYH